MDTQSSSRRALKPAQEQEVAEDWRQPRTWTRQSGSTSSEQSEKAKGGRTRHTVQTVSEATLQWKSICERGAETPKEREMRNGSSAIEHCITKPGNQAKHRVVLSMCANAISYPISRCLLGLLPIIVSSLGVGLLSMHMMQCSFLERSC